MVDHANDLLAVLDDLVDGEQTPLVVVAHSFGSNLTMLAATLRPSAFAAIGLWEPPLPWVEWWPERTKAYNRTVATSNDPAEDIEAMYRSLLGDRAWHQLPPGMQAQRRAEGAAFQVDMASELNAPFNFEDVLVPALVGCGTATSVEHREGARWLVERLPNARLHVSPGAGHFAPRSHPMEFAAFTTEVATLAPVYPPYSTHSQVDST
jgi:pimeloyl-ACP methyl ester carboxylesterase